MADRLEEAFRALRAERKKEDGAAPEAERTLQRVLESSRVRTRRRSHAWKVVVPLAAALVASSAWAGATGRLSSVWSAIVDDDGADDARRSVAPPVPSTNVAAPVDSAVPPATVPPAMVPSATVAVTSAAPPATVAVASATANAHAVVSAPVASSTAAPTGSQSSLAADKADFEAAYRVHASGAAASAVDAWDDYLAKHPSGRFGPEARYARAVALMRAGRNAAARQAFRPFADAPAGSYRRDDALRMLEQLGE